MKTLLTATAATLLTVLSLSVFSKNDPRCPEYAVDNDDPSLEMLDCDYSEKGLNKVLNDVIDAVDSPKQEKVVERVVETRTVVATSEPTKAAETRAVNSALDMVSARYELLQKLATECPAGFKVFSEAYTPNKAGALELTLDYVCQ